MNTLFFLSAVAMFTVQDSIQATSNDYEFQTTDIQILADRPQLASESYRMVSVIGRSEIESLPVQSVSDLLRYLPGIDLRSRGVNGSQADVAVRGGTFDQVRVLVNGVDMTDSHTGHYSLNLPVNLELVERVEILQGGGAVNIVTRSNSNNGSQYTVSMTQGMYALSNPSFTGRWKKGSWYADASASYTHADGYDAPNASAKEQISLDNSDLNLLNVYAQTGWKGLNVQTGLQIKDAGAGMFYGFGSQDQFDATRTAFASASYSHKWNESWSSVLQAGGRTNYDRYEWHRGQRLYGNFHFSRNLEMQLRTKHTERNGSTSFGVEVKRNAINSTNLGDTINPGGQVPNVNGFDLKDLNVFDLVKGKKRTSAGVYLDKVLCWEDLTVGADIKGFWTSGFGWNMTGGLNLGYEYMPSSVVYINLNRSLRLPTFTDMYYDAGNQLGNRDLRPEKTLTLCGGATYEQTVWNARLSLSADAFYRWGTDIIDWVYVSTDAKRPFHATNWNSYNVLGSELEASLSWKRGIRALRLSYSYSAPDTKEDRSGSRYLDCMRHKLVARVEHDIWKGFGASWAFSLQSREGEFNNADGVVCSYEPTSLLDGQLYWRWNNLKCSIDCTNITNRHYYDYGGILQPGRWGKVGVSYAF